MRPVTLSVTVPSPLFAYVSRLGAPAVTSVGPLGIGHSAQLGSAPLVHALTQQAPPLHAPFTHADDPVETVQPCASFAQTARAVPLAQATAGAQRGSALHVHACAPGAPVQF